MATWVAEFMSVTLTAIELFEVVPFPSSPNALLPQHLIDLFSSSAQECRLPVATWVAFKFSRGLENAKVMELSDFEVWTKP